MPQARDEAGNIWETDAQGNPVRLISAAGGPQMPADPSFPYEGPKAAADATNAQVQARVNSATAGSQITKAQADAQKAQAEAALAAKNLARGPERSASEIEAENKQRGELRRAQTIQSILGEVKRLYGQDIKGQPASRLFGLTEKIDSLPRNERFRAAANNILPLIRPLVAQTAKEGDSDKEMEVFLSYIPSNDDSDITIEQKFKQLEMLIGGMVDGVAPSQMIASGRRDDPAVAGAIGSTPQGGTGYGSANPTPPPFSPGDPQMQVAQGARTVEDPAMARVAGQYRQMLGQNRPAGEILQMLREAGASPQTLMQAMAQIKYRAENPNVPLDKYSITATKEVPLSAFEQTATGLGSGAAGAYALGAGNFLSGNNLDSLSGDPERARLAMQVSQAQNPGAFSLGEFSGGVLGALGGELALGRMGVAAGLGRGVASDAFMGGVNGAGAADDSNRFLGAAQGALSSGAGSLAGAGVMKGAARALSPTGGPLADLYASGVRPTPGQRFANSNAAGRMLDKTEQKLQSLPIVGDAISGARQRARDQFQIGAFNEALGEIGEKLPKGMRPGTDPHRFAQVKFNQVYDRARSGMRVVADEELSNDLAALAPDIQTLGPEAQNKLKRILANNVNNRLQDGALSGERYKKAVSDLGKHIARLRGGTMAEDHALADVLQGISGALDNSARRNSDPAAVELLDAADAGYAKLVRIEEAARRRGGDAGTFSPVQFDSATQKSSGGVRSKAYLRGDALMQDYAQQGMSLGDDVPNSGTMDRLAMGGAAAGAGYLEPTTLSVLGAIGLAYAPGVRRAVTGAMAPPGPSRKAIARQLERRARLLGRIGGSASAVGVLGITPDQ